MSYTYQGSKTIGGCLPTVLTANAAFEAALLPRIQACIDAAARIAITVPTIEAKIAAVTALLASLEAALAVGAPSVDMQLAGLAALQADLEAQLAGSVGIGLALGTAGIHLYRYNGAPSGAGTADPPPGAQPSDTMRGVLLVTTDPAAAETLLKFFGVSL